MSKHTPGPWEAHGQKGSHLITVRQNDMMGFRRYVATVGADDTVERPDGRIDEVVSSEGAANARLIAAAPDLLTALEALLLAATRPLGPEFGPKGRDASTHKLARAAIAKARGER